MKIRNRKIKRIFSRNYHTCNRAMNVTKSESIKHDMWNRMSQIILMYSEIFDICVLEAKEELVFALSLEDGSK